MPSIQCPNTQINDEMCPCSETSCSRHGVCCECLAFHAKSDAWPVSACMGGAKRPESTMSLPKAHAEKCSNWERNDEACACSSDKCSRHGVCCDCVRHHWGHVTSPFVACMKGRA